MSQESKSSTKKKAGTKTVKADSKKPEAKKVASKKNTTSASKKSASTSKKVEPKIKKKASSDKTATESKTTKSTLAKKVAPKKTASAKDNEAPKATPKKSTAKSNSVTTSSKKADRSELTFMGIPAYIEKAGEEYMNANQKEHLRQILSSWRLALMEEVDRTVSHMKHEAANFPDPSDRASQEEEFSLELRTRDRERKLIKKIEDSLEHLKTEDFGYCEACGIEIGIKRLEARPTATLCIDCKTLAEIKERQNAGN